MANSKSPLQFLPSEKCGELDDIISMSLDKLDNLPLIKKLNSGGKFYKEEHFVLHHSELFRRPILAIKVC